MAKHKSRAARYAEAQGLVENALGEFESLRDELQDWRDGIPENLQESEKASRLDDAILGLDDVISQVEEIIGTDIEFPGMFG